MNTKPRWDVLRLKMDVEAQFGGPQRDALELSLKAIQQRQGFAKFHFFESNKILKDLAGDGDTGTNLLMQMFQAASPESPGNFQERQLEAAAHAHATLQSVHTFADLLAHATYFSLGMNLTPDCRLNSTAVRMETVQKKIKNVDGASGIALLLDELVSNPDFVYLGQVVNQSKHYAVVDAQIVADLTGAQQHGIVLTDFVRNKVSQPKRRFDSFTKAEFDRQSRLIVLVGIAINDWVANRLRAEVG